MKSLRTLVCFLVLLLVVGAVSANGTGPQKVWARVTVLLEATGAPEEARDTVIPGGIWTTAEADTLGLPEIDRQIVDRVSHTAETIQRLEGTMRLGTLVARQVHLQLQPGVVTKLPVFDIDPRQQISLQLSSLDAETWSFLTKVRFDKQSRGEEKSFHGDPINLQLSDAALHDVLSTFSKLTGQTIDYDPELQGSVTVDLQNVPWDQALSIILRINNLDYRISGDTITVVPLSETGGDIRVLWETQVYGRRAPGNPIMVAGANPPGSGRVVLLIEGLGDAQPSKPERELAMLRVRDYRAPSLERKEPASAEKDHAGDLAIVRCRIDGEGGVSDVEILDSPSPELRTTLRELVQHWKFDRVFDVEAMQGGRKPAGIEVVAGFGLRLGQTRVMTMPEHIGIALTVEPGRKPNTCVVTAEVVDLDSGQVVSAPRITVESGKEAMARSGFSMPDGNGYEVVITVLPDTGHLSYHCQVTTGGRTISEHSASIHLP